jgi:hypothetical protein
MNMQNEETRFSSGEEYCHTERVFFPRGSAMRRLFAYLSHSISAVYIWLVDILSFNSEVESMVEALNHKLDEPPTKLNIKLFSHPGGYIRELGKRRLSIAGAYIKIARDLSPEGAEERLGALRMLIEQSLHAKTINMPLNTARIQIELMKNAVKAQGNKRVQLEAMADFGLASFGQEAVIRGFLTKHHLVEVPEEDQPLKALDMGWDDHVHDTLSEGRKTPTQVLLEAFVKGMSRLSMVYSHIDERRMIYEAITAGTILGIDVEVGIEFSVGQSGNRRHYMFVPPACSDSKTFFSWWEERKTLLAPFHEGLKQNSEHRRKTIGAAIERFNSMHRGKLNQGYEPGSPCWLSPLSIEELDKIVAVGVVSRVHIAELLFQKLRETYHKRVLYLRSQVLAARERFKRGIYSEWELKTISAQYDSIREDFETLTPELAGSKFIDSRDVVDYDSSFVDESAILNTLSPLGGKIVMIHPLEMGLKESMLHIMKHSTFITHVETINLHDSRNRNPNDLTVFNKFIYMLNNRDVTEIMSFLEQHGVHIPSSEFLQQVKQNLASRVLIPVCGSDSTGRDPTIPGMGFIKLASIPAKIVSRFREDHFKIPRPLADLIIHKGKKDPQAGVNSEDSDIICMGQSGQTTRNRLIEEEIPEVIDSSRLWTYLNPTLKELLRTLIGFSVAFWAFGFFGIAREYALIWLGITAFRNILVDLIASSGLMFKNWTLRNVNFDNISQSLFWTGFSVPILNYVKTRFDDVWSIAGGTDPTGFAFEAAKFFFLCLANGLYITTHNKLRNFDRRVIRANFFRSVLAWPFATLFSPAGNAMGIPSTVQTKFWSDFVGGIIEGAGKYRQRYIIRQRDLTELLPKLDSADRNVRLTAMLDLLYIWAIQPRGATCLDQLLTQQYSFWERWRMKKEPPEVTQKRADLYRGFHDKLLNLFGDPGCLNILCEFVLRNYQEKETVLLANLIGVHCESFLGWLRKLRKKTAPNGVIPLS